MDTDIGSSSVVLSGAVMDEARDAGGVLVRVVECLVMLLVSDRDAECVAYFTALTPLSVFVFFGKAKRFPMSSDSTFEGSA